MAQGSSVTTSVTADRRHVPRTAAGIAEGQNLGVGGGVLAELPFVVAGGDDPAVDQGQGPEGTSPWAAGRTGLGQGQSHGIGVLHRRHGRAGGGQAAAPAPRRALSAEEVGFEPTVSFPTHDFQSCRFGRSRTPPELPTSSSREAIV